MAVLARSIWGGGAQPHGKRSIMSL